MGLDAESVIERRRLKRRVSIWRIAAVVLGLLFLGIVVFSDRQMTGSPGILPHVARISVSGVITDDRKMLDLLERAAKADQVRAVILDINSPGGTTTGGEAMYDAIRRLAEKKPVVATCGTLATSAAYIVALATDRIFVYGNTHGFFGTVGYVLTGQAQVESALAGALVGYVSARAEQVIAYYFGSSSGSKQKTGIMGKAFGRGG